jgi:hypothetical protein
MKLKYAEILWRDAQMIYKWEEIPKEIKGWQEVTLPKETLINQLFHVINLYNIKQK